MATTNAAIAEGLESARTLVQRVVRSFYDSRQCILLDQLIRREAMRDDELAGRVGMPIKDLSKIAQILVHDQIVAVHRRLETIEGAMKAQQRTYYYMDYSHATDVVKWRMYKIQSVIDDKLRNELDQQGYVCPRCKTSFTTLDAGFLLDFERNVFVCDQPGCGTELIDNENAEEVKGSKDRMSRLIDQTRVIRDLLKKLDDVVLPRFDVIKWLALNGPEGTALPNAPAASGAGVRIEIAGDDDEAKMKAQREADVEAKRTQNQLPSWIAQSTVNGDSTTSQLETLAAAELAAKRSREIKPSQHDIAATDSSTADFDSYYATLEAAGEPTEEDEVIIETPILSSLRNSATPGSSSATVTPKLEVLSDDEYDTIAVKVEPDLLESVENGNGKRSRDTADDEWDDTASGLEEVAKKARVDSAALSEGAPNEEDDEDDFEFDEGEGADQNTNPMISVAGKLLPFAEVKGSDELTAAMTPDEYIVFWDVYQRIG